MKLGINEEIYKYWSVIKNASDEIKLNLISLLSLSIAKNKNDINLSNHEDPTTVFLNKFSGAWKGDESPEQIIDIIKSNRSSKNPPVFD